MNRIMQWRDIKMENGLKQMSFSLAAEPIQGPYKIVVLKQSGAKEEHSFTVMEYGMNWKDQKEKVGVIGFWLS